MKKTKLLTSLAALALVVSLGACDKTEEDEPTPEPTELINFTLGFTLKDEEGNPTTLPEYATAYVIGGWDNWGAFIPLNLSDGVYSTTFETISVATHEYKVVTWYTDLDVSWDDCFEITTTNQSLKVSASDGDDAVVTVSLTLDFEIPVLRTDSEIIAGILNVASQYEYADEIGWEAYHYTEYEEYYDSQAEFYLTEDEEENVYGSAYIDDEGEVTYSYFRNGLKYNYYPEEDPDNQYTQVEFNDTYTYAIEYFFEPFEAITDYGDEDFDLEDFTVSVNADVKNYQYTLTLVQHYEVTIEDDDPYICNTDYTYTYVTDTDFNLTAIGYKCEDDDDGLTEYYAELVTFDDVTISMGSFNPYEWDIAHSPAELAEQAAITYNYSVEIEWTNYISTNSITYGDYQKARQGDEEATEKYYALFDDIGIYYSLLADIYYTNDYVVYIEYEYDEDLNKYVEDGFEAIYFNGENQCWRYYTEDGYAWNIAYYNPNVWWQDALYSLNIAYYSYDLASDLEYESTITYDDGSTCDVYYFNWLKEYFSYDSAYWFVCLGGDILFGFNANSAFSYAASYWYDEGTYFYESEQMMMTIYSDEGGLYYFDEELTEDTELFYMEEDAFVTVYDVGQTNQDEEAYYWHNYWQEYLASQN